MSWHHKHFPTAHAIAGWYQRRDTFEKLGINLIVWGGVLYIFYTALFAAPYGFPTGAYIRVDEGATLSSIAKTFEQDGVVSSATRFKLVTRLLGDQTKIPAGFYYFSRNENMVWVAMRILTGDFETSPVRVTVTEGSTAKDIAKALLLKVPGFNNREFIERAREGYMFPDTYFFRPGENTQTILSVFDNNFHNKMLKAQAAIAASGHTQDEILTMAAILEKEASKTVDRKMIAGVLWHRILIGMPLQVDAVFPYILGKNTFELTYDDLKFDSPYNTYTHKGLPPGPINNPGLDAILAAAQPTKNNYVFFLSDRQGNFHYAVTYEQHMANKRKYID